MKKWSKALIVPVVAWALWLLPSESPSGTVTTGTAALADTTPLDADSADAETRTSERNPDVLVVAAEPDPPVATTTTDATTTTAVSSTPDASTASVVTTTTNAATVSPTTGQSTTTSVVPSSTTSRTVTPATTTSTVVTATTTDTAPTALAAASIEPASLGDQALELVEFPWRESFPDWQIIFRGPRNGIRALTFPQEKRVEIFIRSSDTAATLHRVFAHELGHMIDVEWNSDEDRQRWRDQRGLSPEAPWWPSAESPDFATGAGDFAEAFAVWETGVTTRSTVGDQPSAADLALLRELSVG